jgi:hypothetical protein
VAKAIPKSRMDILMFSRIKFRLRLPDDIFNRVSPSEADFYDERLLMGNLKFSLVLASHF